MRILFLAALLAPSSLHAQASPPKLFSKGGGSVKVFAYDASGRLMKLNELLAFIGRVDRQEGSPPGIVAYSPDGLLAPSKPTLKQEGDMVLLSWEKLPRVHLSLPWPVAEDGFSTIWADKNGEAFVDGDAVFLNEEAAVTQYRLFKESLRKHMTDWDPIYRPGPKAKRKNEDAHDLMTKAFAQKDPSKRAVAFDKALHATSLAWPKLLFEHVLQIPLHDNNRDSMRFGLTLDASLLQRLDQYKWIIGSLQKSGANWVRLVFRHNPDDFFYENMRSYNEYDAIIDELRSKGIRVMGCVLDTGQWPKTMTPQMYSERVKNLVFHYKDKIRSWEVGSEINGNWLGGVSNPMTPDQVFRIYYAGAAKVKEIDPSLETVATLYWWEGTAPDEEHSLFGWLRKYSNQGFGRNLDVIALSLQPEDNPVGMAFETIFQRVHDTLPDKKILLGSMGYVEQGDKLKGYYWLDPEDVDGARKDLAILFTTISCAAPRSLCGGFWWQALDQMYPGKKTSDLFRVYAKTLGQLGR